MFGTEFCKKCIIVQFLGTEKDGKRLKRRDAEKRSEEDQRVRTNGQSPAPPENE
jgi:hypothetical protein